MSTYYCHDCAFTNGLVLAASPNSLIGTQYQVEKYMKHTLPASPAQYPKNSVFRDPTYSAYEEYVISAAASGYLQVEDWGGKNVIWFAGSTTGVEYRNGQYFAPTNGVKLIWPEDDGRLHAYPIAASPGQSVICGSCGRSIPLW